ncbi:MAG: MerR family DNA-binding transcriptional regulator, partial [Acetobacterium sp.]|nr:MerR family DNA-binding transcriptional regulator [Acetobacterium sp.]
MMAYRIGEVSKLLGLPVETIRYYEKEQIIAPK